MLMSLNSGQIGVLFSFLCSLMWAVAVILFRKSGEKVEPLPLNIFKNSVALILFIFTMLAADIPFFPAGTRVTDFLVLVLSGVIGIALADTLFFAGLNRIGAGLMAIVDCSYSPFVFLCSLIYLDEPMSFAIVAAMLMMVLAIFIGTHEAEQKQRSETGRRKIIIGVIQGLASMALVAACIVIVKPILNRTDPVWAISVRLLGGMVFLTLWGSFPRNRKAVLSVFRPAAVWRYTIPASIFGAYFSLLFWIIGIKYTYTTIASVIGQSSTILIIVLATIFLKEPLTLRKVIAILLGVAGGIFAALLGSQVLPIL